ncbi:hypothetical protein WR25_01623 [Diploscapter pachys]|uniref:Uncharacterized protein n=1 Tax=Diploscapter pachys TaxID=2018661 RepID=A0A2A2L4W6_9BILA|nr:hypothetical protein WR25_01623 [Diploscapter pachys]
MKVTVQAATRPFLSLPCIASKSETIDLYFTKNDYLSNVVAIRSVLNEMSILQQHFISDHPCCLLYASLYRITVVEFDDVPSGCSQLVRPSTARLCLNLHILQFVQHFRHRYSHYVCNNHSLFMK